MRKIEPGEHTRLSVNWNVQSSDYTAEKLEELKTKFSVKYGLPRESVRIVPVIKSIDQNGNTIDYENDISKCLSDPKFQPKLFKRYIDEHEITDCDFDKILEIDDIINESINYELYEQHKRYMIKWIKWDNFMSYGEGNFVDFSTINGLVLLSSEPANQGGKSTFCLDLFRFLLFGVVTSRENDWTLSKAFNRHLPESTNVTVEGCITIDGCDYIIKRTLTRPALNRRSEKSKITHKIEYYRLVNGEYVTLDDAECLNGAGNNQTSKIIKDALGNEKDFDLMICIDSDNLKELISLKDTERGRLISRWIGLLPLEEKDKIAREKFNKEIMPSLMMNMYNKVEVEQSITLSQETINKCETNVKTINSKIDDAKKHLETIEASKDALLSSKQTIDESLLKVDVVTVTTQKERLIEEGKIKRAELEDSKKKLTELGEVNFSEEDYKKLTQEERDINNDLVNLRSEYRITNNDIDSLRKSEYCPTCGAKLANVDNTKLIEEKTKRLEELKTLGETKSKELKVKQSEIDALSEMRNRYNEKIRLQLIVDKKEVDIENLVSKYRECERICKEIEKNKNAIEKNNQIQIQLNNLSITIANEKSIIDRLTGELKSEELAIRMNNENIEKYRQIISTIESEEKLVRNWKVYLELIGKNGINKMVVRSVLPLINAELKNLLSDVCDFDVEVIIDDHNDVTFNHIHDGVVSNLGSCSGFEKTVASLALRTVLSKISTFSKPSFVVFDEILGGVAAVNYDAVKKLYDKMVKSYGTIFEITHITAIHDWHKKMMLVTKKNNISSISMVG